MTIYGKLSVSCFIIFLSRSCVGQFAQPTGSPSPVRRPTITLRGIKVVHQVQFRPDPQVLDVYEFRARWAQPASWNDAHDSQETSGRFYDLQCWLEQSGAVIRTLVNLHVAADFNSYGEKYQFPADADLTLACKVRAVNTLGLSSTFANTNRLRLLDVAITAPGADGLNLRGLSNQDVINTWKNINAAASAQAQTENGGSPGPARV